MIDTAHIDMSTRSRLGILMHMFLISSSKKEQRGGRGEKREKAKKKEKEKEININIQRIGGRERGERSITT